MEKETNTQVSMTPLLRFKLVIAIIGQLLLALGIIVYSFIVSVPIHILAALFSGDEYFKEITRAFQANLPIPKPRNKS